MRKFFPQLIGWLLATLLAGTAPAVAGENWTQFKFDGRHSGNAVDRELSAPLGLAARRAAGRRRIYRPGRRRWPRLRGRRQRHRFLFRRNRAATSCGS